MLNNHKVDVGGRDFGMSVFFLCYSLAQPVVDVTWLNSLLHEFIPS